MKPQSSRSDLVCVLRGISILAIMFYHLISHTIKAPGLLKTAANFGGAGVHIFFICSGFGLALSHLRRPLSPAQFFKKRFLKIYIPYILVVFAAFFIPFTYSGNDRLTALFSHVFLFKMFSPLYKESFSTPFWYISTLFQFYFVFHILIRIKEKLGARRFLIASLATSMLWAALTIALGIHQERIWGSFFLQYLWEFSLGICLADRFLGGSTDRLQEIKMSRVSIITAVSLFLYGFMALNGGVFKSFNDFFGAVSFGGICFMLYQIQPIRPLMRFFDAISFELYLLHSLVFDAFLWFNKGSLLSPAVGMIAVACSVAVACLYHQIVLRFYKALR